MYEQISSTPPLLHLEFDEFEPLRAGVLDRTRLACVLPDEVPIIGRHPAIGVAANDFREHASMHVHAQTRRGLRNLACGLAGLQNHSPGPQSRIVHDLGVTVHARAIRNYVSGRSGLLEDEGDVVEWRRTDICRHVIAWTILGSVCKCR